MKMLMLLFALAFMPAQSHAAGLSLGGGFSVKVSTSLNDFYAIGGWDLQNREPVTGYGKELLPFERNGVEFAYIAGSHLFAIEEGGRGAFGAAIGSRPVTLINMLAKGVGMAGDLIKLPQWAGAASQFASIEFGYSRRGLFGESVPEGKHRDIWSIQGQLRVPVGDFVGLFSKKQ